MGKNYEASYAGTSLAHTCGNVTSIMCDYVKKLFPQDYFRSTVISSSISYRQISIFRMKGKEFFKRDKPFLIIRPRIVLDDSDAFLKGSLLTERMYDNPDTTSYGNLQYFIQDVENDVEVKFLLNRMKMTFDVTIVFESMIEQVNMSSYLKNRIPIAHPFFIDSYLEAFVPKEILSILSKAVNIPMVDEKGKVKPFLDYLNGHSAYPITYKVQDSTGLDEYFRFYPVRIDTEFSDLNLDDGSKRGFDYDTFTTTFSITTEFWGTGLYYIFTPTDGMSIITSVGELDNSNVIIPLFSLPIYKIKAPENWNIYSSIFYKVDRKLSEDETDFSSVIGGTLEACIEYHKSMGIPLETLLSESVMCDDKIMTRDEDYTIDFENFKLVTKKYGHPSATYRLVIFVNTLYMNELKKKIFDLK